MSATTTFNANTIRVNNNLEVGLTADISGNVTIHGETLTNSTVNLNHQELNNVKYISMSPLYSEKIRLEKSQSGPMDNWITSYNGSDRKWILNMADHSHSNSLRIWNEDAGTEGLYSVTLENDNQTFNIGTNYSQSTYQFAVQGTSYFNDTIISASHLPALNDSWDLGSSSFKWDNVYTSNGPIQTSDQRMKSDITASDLGLNFINSLSPVKYKFTGKQRTHYGLISQSVKSALINAGKTFNGNLTDDFAGYCYNELGTVYDNVTGNGPTSKDPSGNDIINTTTSQVERNMTYSDLYSLRYEEFIAPMIKAIQELSTKVTEQQAEIDNLKSQINN